MSRAGAYIRTQGIVCAVINAVLNPALAWLGNRHMRFVPANNVVVDTGVTTVVLSLLVALCVTPGVRAAMRSGSLVCDARVGAAESWLLWLPARAWGLGLVLGIANACVVIPLMLVTFHMLAIAGLSFAAFALFKAVYTASLGYLATRWVIMRRLAASQSG